MSASPSTSQQLSSRSGAALVILLAVLAVHLPSLLFPYYFVDDVWLYRRPGPGFPNVYDLVVIQQGRPVFAVLILATQELRARLGIDAVLIVRSCAVVFVALFAYSVYRFLRLWQTALMALCCAILLITLPSFQMYVSAAPLFAPSLAYCGFVVYVFGQFVVREKNTRRHWAGLLLSTAGLIFVWGTYQAIPLLVIGMLTPLLLSTWWESNPRWERVGAFLAGVGVSLILYYAVWRIANIGIPSDLRYSPRIADFHLIGNLALFRTFRVPQIFSFWDTRQNPPPYIYACIALIAAALALDLASTKSRRLARAALWAVAIGVIVAVDIPVLLAPASNTFSYMTSAPAATATFFLVASAAAALLRGLVAVVPPLGRAAGCVVMVVCGASVTLASRNVIANQVVPNWLEYALVRSELRRHATAGSDVSSVKIFTRNSLLGRGRDEFSWSNFSMTFWAHWTVRDILDEIGASPRIRIDVVDGNGSVTTNRSGQEDVSPPTSGREVTVDLRNLDLRAPSGQSLWRRLALAPDGLVMLPVGGIHSTLTFIGSGASGQHAAIDGDSETAAADPKGFNAGTFITLELETPADVAGLRILSAHQYGVALASAFRARCGDDGTAPAFGTIDVKAGTDLWSEASLNAPCRSRVIRLEPMGPTPSSNFWIAEIQVLGRR